MTTPSRLVVRAPNWLGDAVMALPALGAIRAAFPDARIAIAAATSVAPLFEEDTAAAQDELIALGAANAHGKTAESSSGALTEGKFDAALLLPNSFRAAWTVRRAGIPERWGYAANLRGWLLTRAVARPKARHLHQSEYYRELVRGLGLDAPESLPRLHRAPRDGPPRRRAAGPQRRRWRRARSSASRRARRTAMRSDGLRGGSPRW